MSKPTVAVLMSTYNGEKYLKEQIDSILQQEDVDLQLFIRDDGSSDSTLSIITSYCKIFPNIKLISDSGNLGPGLSFWTLLKHVVKEFVSFDYYSFADQDDIWLKDKLIFAINSICNSGFYGSILYSSNQYLYVDGKNIGLRHYNSQSVDLIPHMTKNTIAGCTFLFNRALAKIAVEGKDFNTKLLKYRLHDAWLFLVAIVCGHAIYDNTAHMLYRIHSGNVVGVRKFSFLNKLQRMLNLFNGKTSNIRLLTAKELLFLYPNMHEECRRILNLYANYNKNLRSKKKFLKNKDIIDNCQENRVIFVIKILLNLI